MSSLVIEVVPLMGRNPKDVCREACLLAHKLNVTVELTMNGILLVAGTFAKSEDLHGEYLEKVEAKLRNEPGFMVQVDRRCPANHVPGDTNDPIGEALAVAEKALRAGCDEIVIARYPRGK